MLVSESGSVLGSLSGGCVEGAVVDCLTSGPIHRPAATTPAATNMLQQETAWT
jgi:xanthine/CO dehydrogenase XdhC/CoxF family maturation factor